MLLGFNIVILFNVLVLGLLQGVGILQGLLIIRLGPSLIRNFLFGYAIVI